MEVDIFIPCFIDQLYPEVGFQMVKVLKAVGCRVNYNTNQTCCGQPAFNAGLWKDAEKVAEKFIKDFEKAKAIIVPSASCVGFVRNNYAKLLSENQDLTQAKNLGPKIFELTEFLNNFTQINKLTPVFEGKATYHDSCSALRECKIKQGPRKLLNMVQGLELIELADSETCCGFGGTFAIKYEPISTAMLEQKLEAVEKTGADYIISTDVSCLMHMEAYIKKQGFTFKTAHIAEVLAGGMP